MAGVLIFGEIIGVSHVKGSFPLQNSTQLMYEPFSSFFNFLRI